MEASQDEAAVATLMIGDIVETRGGAICLVVKTRKDTITLHSTDPELGDLETTVDAIKVIHARTKADDRWDHKANGEAWEKTTYDLTVEMHNGRIGRFNLPADPELYDLGYGNRAIAVRRRAFPAVMARWDELLTAP
jgi:hypothetical protein